MGLGDVGKSAELLLHVAMIRKKIPLARLSIKRAEPWTFGVWPKVKNPARLGLDKNHSQQPARFLFLPFLQVVKK